MRGSTLPFSLSLFSLFSRPSCPSPPSLFFDFPFFFLSFFFKKKKRIHGSHYAMCPSLIQVRFYLETIYLFSVQFILNELSSSHFLTSQIFVKISLLEYLKHEYGNLVECLCVGHVDMQARMGHVLYTCPIHHVAYR